MVTKVMVKAFSLALITAWVAAVFILAASAHELDPNVTSLGTTASVDCSGTLHSLFTCLPAVEGDDPEPPSKDCCTAIQRVNSDCLCSALGAGNSGDFPELNVGAAILLPRECGRMVPKGFKCAGYLIPSPE